MLELECFTTSDNNAYRHWASKAVNQNMRQQDIVACRWQNTPTTYKTESPRYSYLYLIKLLNQTEDRETF